MQYNISSYQGRIISESTKKHLAQEKNQYLYKINNL